MNLLPLINEVVALHLFHQLFSYDWQDGDGNFLLLFRSILKATDMIKYLKQLKKTPVGKGKEKIALHHCNAKLKLVPVWGFLNCKL